VEKKSDLIMSSTITTTTTINNDYEYDDMETTENPDWVRLMIEKYNALGTTAKQVSSDGNGNETDWGGIAIAVIVIIVIFILAFCFRKCIIYHCTKWFPCCRIPNSPEPFQELEDIPLTPARMTFQLKIGNISDSATYEMIYDLFRQYGPLKSAALDYDANGQKLGTANFVYERRADAVYAFRECNGFKLDNQPLHLIINFTLIGADLGGSTIALE
jgi:hypothetical protein